MTIQGKQVPMYTKHTLFLYFCDFSIFLYEKQNWKVNRQKHVKQSNCIKLDWLKTWKQNTWVMHTQNKKRERERERKMWLNHLELFSFHNLEEPFRLANPWSGDEGEELKPFKFERNMRALRRSPRGAKEDGNWFWVPDEIILLLYWVANDL